MCIRDSLLVPEGLPVPEPEGPVDIDEYPATTDVFVMLRTIRHRGVDVIVVPPLGSAGAPPFVSTAILTASAIGARLVVPPQEPWVSDPAVGSMILVEHPFQLLSWRAAFDSILSPGHERSNRLEGALPHEYSSGEAAARLAHALERHLPADESEAARLRRFALSLEDRAADVPGAEHDEVEGAETPSAVQATHRLIRRSRRMNAFRSPRRSPLAVPGRGDAIEVSEPLGLVSYLQYEVVFGPGGCTAARVEIRGTGDPGESIGFELVDPAGAIVARAEAPLPLSSEEQAVVFRFPRVELAERGVCTVRLFTRSKHRIEVLERVSRGIFGLGRPRVSPLIDFIP
jgi:hypothetical protein